MVFVRGLIPKKNYNGRGISLLYIRWLACLHRFSSVQDKAKCCSKGISSNVYAVYPSSNLIKNFAYCLSFQLAETLEQFNSTFSPSSQTLPTNNFDRAWPSLEDELAVWCNPQRYQGKCLYQIGEYVIMYCNWQGKKKAVIFVVTLWVMQP